MYSKSVSAAIVASFFASANAHFFISSPVPIPGNAIKDPLDPSGSNFPCHGADVSQGTVTPLTAGSTFNLQYELGNGANTAVHGGGSCQISLTYETDPAKLKDPSNWKVIQSFIGGCPTNAKGNLDGGAGAVMCNGSNDPACVNALSFGVPSEVQSGDAILAWTWFNNIGNREMYMNCAKVSISGGSGDMSGLPGMAVANLASVNQCKTTEQFNVDFPSPGKYVTQAATLNYPKKALVGSNCSGSGSGSGTGGSGSAPANPPASGGNGGAATSVPASQPSAAIPSSGSGAGNGNQGGNAPKPSSTSKPGNGNGGSGGPGGIFAPGAGGAPTTLVTSSVPAATQAPSTGNGSAPPATGGSQGACSAGQLACTASGFYCVSAFQYGMCNFGCAIPMDMAAGTECSAGVVKAIALPNQRRKRSVNRHLHARAHQLSSPLL